MNHHATFKPLFKRAHITLQRETRDVEPRKPNPDDQISVLTIAGSDCSGGAGIQADIKAISTTGAFATSVITAVTAQNTCGVRAIQAMDPQLVADQIDAVFEDIPPQAVKTGMLPTPEIIHVVAQKMRAYHVKKLVVDPVLVATSGDTLVREEALDVLKKELLPYAFVVTPNIPEAERLTGLKIASPEEMCKAGEYLCDTLKCPHAIVKGGHLKDQRLYDVLIDEDMISLFPTDRVRTKNTHGTGCSFSATVAADLAWGDTIEQAFRDAQEYIHWAIRFNPDLGKGSGPIHLNWIHEKELCKTAGFKYMP